MANAVDAMASVPKTASATRLFSRCSSSASDDSGDPISSRFNTEYTQPACHAGALGRGIPRGYRTSLTTDFIEPVMKFGMSAVVFSPAGLANAACIASASSKVSDTTQNDSGAEPSKLVSARPYSYGA